MHCSRRLIVQTLVFSRSYLHRQVSPPETLVVKGGTTWARNGRWILPENARLPRNIQGSFTCRKSTTWDRRLYFALKNPTASAGFEPANLGTKGQYATSRPPKPQFRRWGVPLNVNFTADSRETARNNSLAFRLDATVLINLFLCFHVLASLAIIN